MPLPDIVHRALVPNMLHVPLRLMQHWLKADGYTYGHFASIPNLKNMVRMNNFLTNIDDELMGRFLGSASKHMFNTPIADLATSGKARMLEADLNHSRYGEFYRLFSEYGYNHFLVFPIKTRIGTSILVYVASKPIKPDNELRKQLQVFNRSLHAHTHINLANYFDPYLIDINPNHLLWLQTKVDYDMTTKQVAEHHGVKTNTVAGAFKRMQSKYGYSNEAALVHKLTKIGYLK